jgi:hypothetical protein
MIQVIKNCCVLKTVTVTNMKLLENSKETHKDYLEIIDVCSADVNAIFKLFPCTPQM